MTGRRTMLFVATIGLGVALGLPRARANVPAGPRAVAATSADAVALGDPFALQIEIEHDSAAPVEVPATLDLGEGFVERARSVRAERRGDRTTTKVRLELVAVAVGDVVVPPVPVRYTAGGGAATVSTQPVPLRVTGVVGDSDRLRPIAPPVRVEYRDWFAVYAAAGFVGVVFFLWAGRRAARALGRRRRRRAVAVRSTAREQRAPPADEALARLAELEASGALDSDDRKPAFQRLSEIMRDYAGRRFDFPGLELSTDEIRRALRGRDADDIAARLGEWLDTGDMVKFAGYDASADEARTALYDARRMVQDWSANRGGRARTGEGTGGPAN